MKKTLPVFKKIWFLAVIGLLIRLMLMPITFHPDIWAISFSQHLFAYKGVLNIYDYLGNLPKSSSMILNYGRNFFTYPPLAYFTLGIFGIVLKPFFNTDFVNNLAGNLPNILNDSRLYWHLFLTKFPYLFFDFGILFFLIKLFDDDRKKKMIALLWIFNPLSLYTTYMIGQFDIIPVFFTILSLYLVKIKKPGWGAFALGIGGAFKMFPLFFLPFLVVTESKNFWNSIKLFAVGLLPFLVTILPFLSSIAFRQTVLFSNQSQKMIFAKIPVSGAEYLSIFVVFYVFFLGIAFLRKADLWKCFMVIMLLFFGVTHYHPQWFLWLSPFLLIYLVTYPRFRFFPVILFFCWFLIMIFFEPSLSVSLFAPICHSLNKVKPLSDFLSKYYDVFQFKSMVRSIFAGTSSFLIFRLFTQKNNEA